MANANKPMTDLPFWELTNQAPVASSALSCMTTVEDGTNRFIYYMTGALFYRHDCYADTWQQLATPVVTPATVMDMTYTKRRGHHGRVLSATSTTVQIAGLRGQTLDGETIAVQFGTGANQDRVLTWVSETVHDAGVLTAVNTSAITDGLKKWQPNQWVGYLVGITYGTDATQYKRVLYNDATTLTVADANLQPHEPWNNQIFVATAPYALPVASSHYQIMSSTFNVPAWTVIPDNTSFFTTYSGGIYLISSVSSAPFFTFQYYDVAADYWQTKTVPQSLLSAALSTDVTMERTGKLGTALVTKLGTTSGTARTLTDSGLALVEDESRNYRVFITGGTGAGQNRRITSNTATTFSIPRSWDITPDATTTYEVWPDSDRVYVMMGLKASMLAYSPENDYWMQGQGFDDGVVTNISATLPGWMPFGVSTGVRIAAGVTSVASTPTAPGSGYAIGDVLTCSVGGTGAQVIVTSIAPLGLVTGVRLSHSGTATGFVVGTGKSTTSGTGAGCTINITGVGATALITLTSGHYLKTGQSVNIAGCSESAWNVPHTIIGVNGLTSFSVATPATLTMVAAFAQSSTSIVDPTKSWIPNEHVGRLVSLNVAGLAPTSQIRWITANTATTLTIGTITAGVNGTSKYNIHDAKIFGADDQRKETGMSGYGHATGGSVTTLVDTKKNWVPNQWANYFFKIEAGTGYGSGRIVITSNTETTLTFATQTTTPDLTTRYEIANTWGLISAATLNTVTEATSKKWDVNQWNGKYVRITGSTLAGTEAVITAGNANTVTAAIGTPDITTPYAILSIPVRGTGTGLLWTWGATDIYKKSRMYSPRGGVSNTFDMYDISTERWTFGYFFQGQSELFTTGSSYCYDGIDTIYMSRSVAAGPIRVLEYGLNTNKLIGATTTTIVQNAVHVGNALEIVDAPDGTSFLYTLQNTGTQMCRAVLF